MGLFVFFPWVGGHYNTDVHRPPSQEDSSLHKGPACFMRVLGGIVGIVVHSLTGDSQTLQGFFNFSDLGNHDRRPHTK